jgi:hypothetical protein
MGLLLLLRDLVVALIDVCRGTLRRRYDSAIDIRAPRRVVWELLKARDVDFDGYVPLRVVAQPLPGRPGLDRVSIIAGATRLVMTTRIVEERPGEAILYELLSEGTDPALVEGDDDYIAFLLSDVGSKTRLELVRETTPRHLLSRLTVPLGLRSGARRYKRKAEAMAAAEAHAAPAGSGGA